MCEAVRGQKRRGKSEKIEPHRLKPFSLCEDRNHDLAIPFYACQL